MTTKTNGTTKGAGAVPASAIPEAQLPEAPVSVTVKLSYRGLDTMLTMRGHTGAEVLTRLGTALDWLAEHGPAPAPTSAPAAATTAQVSAAAPTCPTHGSAMRAGKNGGWFCPRKVAEDDGTGKPAYCRQRVAS